MVLTSMDASTDASVESPQIHPSQSIRTQTRVLITADEFHELTGWGRGRIYEMMADGRLPVVRAGRRVRIHWPTVEKWFAEQASTFDGERLRETVSAA